MNRRLRNDGVEQQRHRDSRNFVGVYVFTHMSTTLPTLGLVLNYVRYLNAPAGTLTTQINPTATAASTPLPLAVIPAVLRDDDWPSYNKTLDLQSFFPARANQCRTMSAI